MASPAVNVVSGSAAASAQSKATRVYMTDDPGVDEMELRIGARPYERSGK